LNLGEEDNKITKNILNFSGLFIIDDKGILRQITVNDLPVGRSVDETLRLVQAFQFTDKHGEGMLIYFTYLIIGGRREFFSHFRMRPQIHSSVENYGKLMVTSAEESSIMCLFKNLI
jgi:hypothetical protein